MRIGLLEDDAAIQEMVLLVLQEEGYTVVNFPSAEACTDALGLTKQDDGPIPIDLLIIDWRLSGNISGTEIIQYIRKNDRLRSLPIILTTAATFNDTEILQNMHISLLEKPFSVDEIVTLIKQLVQPYTPT